MKCTISNCEEIAYHAISGDNYCAEHYHRIVGIGTDPEKNKQIPITAMKQEWYGVLLALNVVMDKMATENPNTVNHSVYLQFVKIRNTIKREADLD